MSWRVAFACLMAGACGGAEPDPSDCTPACGEGLACRYDTCVPTPTVCNLNTDCAGDRYCDITASECLPWGVGPGGSHDIGCHGAPVAGVFFPGVQCEWAGPPPGDSFPAHVNVLATPMVATFDRPSIVFTSYNFTDHLSESCIGTDPSYFGVI